MAKRILIAEDDPSSLSLLKIILEADGGFEVVTATDGEAAWALLESGKVFDVCIFDIMMPRLDGLALTKRVREHPHLREQPVILCTALSDRTSVSQAAALTVSHYLVKPYARERVVKEVRQICAESSIASKCEPLAHTAGRLGISERQVNEFLGDIAKEATALVVALRAGPAKPGGPSPLIRINGLKGAAINFGAHGLFRALTTLEEKYGATAEAVNEEALRDVEREIEGLASVLPAAGASAKPGRQT